MSGYGERMSTPLVFIESDYDESDDGFCLLNLDDITAFETRMVDDDADRDEPVAITSAVLRNGERYTLWIGESVDDGVAWVRSKLRHICEQLGAQQ